MYKSRTSRFRMLFPNCVRYYGNTRGIRRTRVGGFISPLIFRDGNRFWNYTDLIFIWFNFFPRFIDFFGVNIFSSGKKESGIKLSLSTFINFSCCSSHIGFNFREEIYFLLRYQMGFEQRKM